MNINSQINHHSTKVKFHNEIHKRLCAMSSSGIRESSPEQMQQMSNEVNHGLLGPAGMTDVAIMSTARQDADKAAMEFACRKR